MTVHSSPGCLAPVYDDKVWEELAYQYRLAGGVMTKAVSATNKILKLDLGYQTANNWRKEKPAKWAIFDDMAKTRISKKFRPGYEAILAAGQEAVLDMLLNGEDGTYDQKKGEYAKKRPTMQHTIVAVGIADTKLQEMDGPKRSAEKPAQEAAPQKSRKDLAHENRLWREAREGAQKVH